MTAKIKASADGLKVTIGNAAEDALEIDQTAKTIKGINGYVMAGNGPAFRAYRSGTGNGLTSQVNTKIIFNSEDFDTNNNYNTVDGRFTPTVAGYYQVTAAIGAPLSLSTQSLTPYLRKNDAAEATGATVLGDAFNSASTTLSALVYMNGTTDYLEVFALVSIATSANPGRSNTFFSASLVRAA